MGVVALIACTVLVGGCRREQKQPLASVEVIGPTVQANPQLGVTDEQVTALFEKALVESGRFVLPSRDPEERAKQPDRVALSLEFPFTREAVKEGRDGVHAEVAATLTIRRQVDSIKVRYEVVGLGEAPISAEEARPAAMQRALREAIAQVVSRAHLQLAAMDKSDAELQQDLRSDDSAVREFALRILIERQNPAVAGVLIERLRALDLEQIREAMGALAELREQRAVKPLIELTRGKDPVFVREILFALAQIGGEEAMAYLYTVAQGHDEPALREAAQRALDEIELRRENAAGIQGGQP